jgi:preprotein translocase subunit SecD
MRHAQSIRAGGARLSGLFRRAYFSVLMSLLLLPAAAAEPIAVELMEASVRYDQRTGEPIVIFVMTSRTATRFAELTRNNIGRKAEIRVDGRVVTSPIIREPILGRAMQISAGFTLEQAKDLAARLSAGTAKLEIDAVD